MATTAFCDDRELITILFLACRNNDLTTVQSIIPRSIHPTTGLSHHGLYGMRFKPRESNKEETTYGYDAPAYSGRGDEGECTYYTDTDGGGHFYSDHFLPIFFAAAGGHIRCVDYILGCEGASIDASNHSGITALMVALTCGQGAMVNHLIMRGAKLSSTISGTLVLPHMRGISAADLLVKCITRREVCVSNAPSSGDSMTAMGAVAPAAEPAAPEPSSTTSSSVQTWTCSQCTLINSSALLKCEACENPKS